MLKLLKVRKFIKESAKFGFHISKRDGVYFQTTTCNCCGNNFSVPVDLSNIDKGVHLEDKCHMCKCSPVRCRGCVYEYQLECNVFLLGYCKYEKRCK